MSDVPLFSIVTAMTDGPEWAELLIKSVRLFTTVPYELILIDNAARPESLEWVARQLDIRVVHSPTNGLHGGAMDLGTQEARGQYVCHMDLDSHFQRKGWEDSALALYRRNPKTRMLCKAGPIDIGRPVHPPMFLYDRQFFVDNKLIFKHQRGVPRSVDTAQKTYWDVLDLGYNVELFGKWIPIYNMAGGDEIWMDDKPTMYHHHYGASLKYLGCNQWRWSSWKIAEKDAARHERRTASLFTEPLVKQILKEGER